ncbi:phosphofructokinase family protein [Dunaliella salina]|uniref:Phosphofructokinase family protein n=1 Tax=Dunaliella salina TaxID=3046 RepID=A0ABQ7GF43_DUNSA|nr:phosphofructokinase family protein [Dunaliella salina]|eukprot:KAF5833218.1 phosphofructokinase family protein [Dunaliella salina]
MLYRRAGANYPVLRDRSVASPVPARHVVISNCKAEAKSSTSAPAPPSTSKPEPVDAGVSKPVGQAPDGKKVVSVAPTPQYTATPYTAGRVSGYTLDEEEDVLPLRNVRAHLKPMDSPFVVDNNRGGGFVGDRDRVRLHTVEYESQESAGAFCADGIATFGDEDVCLVLPEWAIRCGPRKTIYADPTQVSAAVVTCGGLCPGLNDVIQNIVYTLRDYGVPEDNILGIKYGLRGFYERDEKPVNLTEEKGGGVPVWSGPARGTSRGGANIKEIVRRIALWGLNMVFVIGGNGGNAAAHAIAEECEASGVVCSVVAVPKSIDNDILLVDRCFGFETAVEEAQRALLAAKVEASSAHNGIGLVKLMGRQSGFIAMQASMASGVVDVCLIPEIQFDLQKLNEYVAKVMERKGHCVICLAEGAGQNVVKGATKGGTDASGNPILADIGPIVKDSLKEYMKGDCDIKYIDPTYMIRAIPTTTNDRVYCKVLGQGAVHGAFAGYTDITVGLVNTHYVYMPIQTIIQAPRRVNPTGRRWNRLVCAIGQPDFS